MIVEYIFCFWSFQRPTKATFWNLVRNLISWTHLKDFPLFYNLFRFLFLIFFSFRSVEIQQNKSSNKHHGPRGFKKFKYRKAKGVRVKNRSKSKFLQLYFIQVEIQVSFWLFLSSFQTSDCSEEHWRTMKAEKIYALDASEEPLCCSRGPPSWGGRSPSHGWGNPGGTENVSRARRGRWSWEN